MTAISDQIQRDRNDEEINRQALKTAIQVFVDLGKEGEQKPIRRGQDFFWTGIPNLAYYETQFEAKFLDLTIQHCHEKANQWINECDSYQYLNEVKKALDREETNADFWLQA